MERRGRIALGAACALLLGGAPAAHAVPDCAPNQPAPKTLLSGRGVLESAISDAKGRLFYTDTGLKALMRLDSPTSEPKVVADGIDSPGGLALEPDGKLLVGYGDSVAGAQQAPINPQAGLLRIDPDTGARSTYATGLAMANGIVRDVDGTVFGSTDVGTGIDRVAPDRSVTPAWARVVSSNGLAIDRSRKWLYVNQTFVPAAISRVEIANPSHVEPYVAAPTENAAAGLDGMTIDERDRLYVAANGGGEVWRVDPDRKVCALARGFTLPSAVALGAEGHGFHADSLYVVTFSGVVAEIPHVRELTGPIDDVPPRLRLTSVLRGRLRLTLSEPARLVVRLERRRGKAWRAAATLAASGKPGANSVVLRVRRRALASGRWRARVTAVDRVGNRAPERVLAFTVRPARKPADPPR
jgi:gluconolactonase